MVLKTTEGKEHLIFEQEMQYGINSEEENLLFLTITNEAENGVCVTDHEVGLKASVEGAVILGFGSANPKPAYSYQTKETETFHGRALLILQRMSGTGRNPVQVKVSASGAEYNVTIQ